MLGYIQDSRGTGHDGENGLPPALLATESELWDREELPGSSMCQNSHA